MFKIRALKIIDRLVGTIVTASLPSASVRTFPAFRRFLIIRPGGIGDAVLLTSAINLIKSNHPNAHITILAEQRNAGVFSLVPTVDKVFCYDITRDLLQALLGRFDVVIDTEQWYRLSAVVARLVRAPIKIGFDTNERRRMFTHGMRYDLGAYEPGNFLALLKPLGMDCQRDVGTVTLALPLQSVSKASQLLQPLSSDSFVVIFPGASIPEKRWGAERFTLVSKRLSEYGYRVVVVGGRNDRVDGDTIVGDVGLNLAGKTTLAETAAVIAHSSLVVSGDTGVLHLAVGLNVPTVSLFGPSSAAKWAPQGEKHIVLNNHLPCSPCSDFGTIPPCFIGVRCIRDITPDAVIDAVWQLLPQPPQKIHQ